MANRTMQAKALKLQLQLRKLPRHMPEDVPGKFTEHSNTPIPSRLKAEGVSTPRTPNRELIQGYKHRAKSLAMEDSVARFKGVTPARKLVIDKIAFIMEAVECVTEDMNSFTLFSSSYHRARVFFNPQRTCWMLVHEDFRAGTIGRSMVYSDKVRLVDDFKSKKRRLVWVELRLSNHTEGG